ncbi:MAG TPA: hypothetical protein VN428_11300 [Bryobacteraceae bacterium]|nr:hypothetical protein [Bryobacteraceae bacterium]
MPQRGAECADKRIFLVQPLAASLAHQQMLFNAAEIGLGEAAERVHF